MSFGERLRNARKEAGLSQTELAGSRCSVSYVSHLESGRRTPTPEILRYFESALGLEAGALGDKSDMSLTGRRKAGEAEIAALYAEAVNSWRHASFGLAFEQAREARRGLAPGGRSDLALLLGALVVEINIDLAHYAEAHREAVAHLAASRAAGSPLLEVRAGILASNAARLDGKREEAASLAADAVALTESAGLSDSIHVSALIAAIAALHTDSDAYTATLERVVESMAPSHAQGLGLWVLGAMSMRAGLLEEGNALLERAGANLSPAADFRNWARFPRAVADERLEAGVESGVAELLTEARARLELLNNPDEFATLAIVGARLARAQGRYEDALAELGGALGENDLPASTRARLNLALAMTYEAMGETSHATTIALKAARAFTEAGDVAQAQAAWALVDEIGGTDV